MRNIGKSALKLKKGLYQLIGTKYVDTDKIYFRFKENHAGLINKYHINGCGHPMLFKNTPIASFAFDYVKEQLNSDIYCHRFIGYYCDFYNCYTTEYKQELVKRIISVIKSVEKIGYAEGKYKKRLIGLCEGVNPKYGMVDGYELISGKHRCAACIALGKERIKCQIYRQVKR